MDAFDKLFQDAMADFTGRRLPEAIEKFQRVLDADPGHVPALNLITLALVGLGRHAEAEPFIARAIERQPASDISFYNHGLILKVLGRPEQALAQFGHALRLNPNVAETWLSRGAVLNDLKRYKEAIADFDRALALRPSAEALCNKGKSLTCLNAYGEAIRCYDKALSIAPDLAEAWLGRSVALVAIRSFDQAFAAIDAALRLRPDLAEAWSCRGNALFALKRYGEAAAAYDKALTLRPDLEFIEGLACFAKLSICDWSDLAARRARLSEAVRRGERSVSPFEFVAISSSAKDQLDCARARNRDAPATPKETSRRIHGHDRLRIGYVSSDFKAHAISHLAAGLFECHDRSKFEITAISIGPDDQSDLRKRVERSFDRFIDATTLPDEEVEARIRALEIDILVDLNGHSGGARTGVFAHRAAPIQVNYLGYPGTMGADFIDYLIGDATVIPPQHRAFYAEKVVQLPHSYQVNDAKRELPQTTPARSQASLPDNGIVFCCFNNSFKVGPEAFACWMRILGSVDGSVLWLLDDSALATANLRSEAASRGVDPGRIVFAPRVSVGEHLARHGLADIFLDTWPYNAHTTASDALWAGLPVVTWIGETFAGRVAASLLNAVGLPELITSSQDAYEALAIELARDPARLNSIKHRLAANRSSCPLFDTARFTRAIEEAYEIMHRRYRDGLAPDHIEIAAKG